jgi:hypothetical protein
MSLNMKDEYASIEKPKPSIQRSRIFPDQPPHQKRGEKRRDAARTHRIAALQRRITHQRLQKQRQFRRRAVKDAASDRHQHQPDGENSGF